MPTPLRRTEPANWWPEGWTLLDSPPASALDNMATDLALLRRAASTGRAVLRLYAWERPTVSFGRHEAVRGIWDMEAIAAAGLDAVRRPTGGRALLHAPPNAEPLEQPERHAHDVTYSVTMPLRADQPWRDVYNAINAQLLGALRSLGVPASVSARSSTLSPNGALCFTAPSEGEIMLADQKIAGSAVWRADGGYLQHGSILLRNMQQSLESFKLAADAAADANPAPAPSERSGASAEARRRAFPCETAPFSSSPAAAQSPWSDASSVAQAIRNAWREMSRDIYTFKPSPEDVNARLVARHELAAPDWLWRR